MRKGDFSTFDNRHLALGYRFVRHWPDSLNQHILKLGHGRSGTIQVLLGRLAKYVAAQAPANPLTRLMQEAIPRAIANANLPVQTRKTKRLPTAWRRHDVLSQKEAIQKLKIDLRSIKRLQNSPNCVASPKIREAGTTLYNRDALERAIENWRGSNTFEAASTLIGAPPYSVQALIDEELLSETFCPDALLLSEGRKLVSKSSAINLLQRLDSKDQLCRSTQQWTPFGVAMAGILHPVTWALVIKALVRGTIRHKSPQSPPRSLKYISVDSEALDHFRAEDALRELPNVSVSGQVAASLLNVSNPILSGAVARKLLAGERQAQLTLIPLSEVRRFQNNLIGSWEITHKTGISCQRFAADMRRLKVEPSIKIHSNMFWNRSEISELLGSQIQ